MPPSKQVNVRLQQPTLIRLSDFAGKSEVDVSAALRGLIPSDAMSDALALASLGLGKQLKRPVSPIEAMHELVSLGLIQCMTGPVSNPRLPTKTFEGKDRDGVAVIYCQYVHAQHHKQGVRLPDGTAPLFKFQTFPDSDFWRARGFAGGDYAVLPVQDDIVADGVINRPFPESRP